MQLFRQSKVTNMIGQYVLLFLFLQKSHDNLICLFISVSFWQITMIWHTVYFIFQRPKFVFFFLLFKKSVKVERWKMKKKLKNTIALS